MLKTRLRFLLAAAATCTMLAVPAQAGRTAIDSITNPDGSFTPKTTFLSGYCDLSGEECSSADGARLNYSVSFDGVTFLDGTTATNKVFVQGNGILTFGDAIDFSGTYLSDGRSLYDLIYLDGIDPALGDYQRALVSAGQNNALDGGVFYQSASLTVQNDVIRAEWFTCASPFNCRENPYSLTLRPTAKGFMGTFDGASGDYVAGGDRVSVAQTFFLPATITGLTSAVPEPASWGLMIVGFGLVGVMMRRRSARPQPELASMTRPARSILAFAL